MAGNQTWVAKGKRGRWLLRWKDDRGRTRERQTDLPADPRNYKQAIRLAAQLADELDGKQPPQLILTHRQRERFQPAGPMDSSLLDGSWQAFLAYYQQNHLAGLSESYRKSMLPILGRFEEFARPQWLSDVTSVAVRRWLEQLRQEGLTPASVRTYWRHLAAFLRVANDDGLLLQMPRVRLPRMPPGSQAKGRPITMEELERMKQAAEIHRPADFEQWHWLLDGLWNSGLRIGEAYRLTWKASGFCLDLDRRRPCFLIEQQKNKQHQRLPMVPEFARQLQQVDERQRRGRVFCMATSSGRPMALATVKRQIASLGSLAGVRVSENKTATAHDLRRAFAARWAARVLPQVLQQLMRHQDISTTLKFYASQSVDQLAEQVWSGDQAEQPTKQGKP